MFFSLENFFSSLSNEQFEFRIRREWYHNDKVLRNQTFYQQTLSQKTWIEIFNTLKKLRFWVRCLTKFFKIKWRYEVNQRIRENYSTYHYYSWSFITQERVDFKKIFCIFLVKIFKIKYCRYFVSKRYFAKIFRYCHRCFFSKLFRKQHFSNVV